MKGTKSSARVILSDEQRDAIQTLVQAQIAEIRQGSPPMPEYSNGKIITSNNAETEQIPGRDGVFECIPCEELSELTTHAGKL